MGVKSYRDLRVWQRGMELSEKVYQVTQSFPKDELYSLTNQMRRASVSIPSNLAEGSARRSKPEFARFVNIASGSLAELETQVMLAARMKYVSSDVLTEILAISEEIGKMLYALQQSLISEPA